MDMRFKNNLFHKRSFTMVKKLVCLIAAVGLALGMSACAGSAAIDMDKSANVSSNGGFLVETGDYVYFINGVESYSTTYKTGEVVKAALMRTSKKNLAKLGKDGLADGDYETVVNKLMVSGDKTAGFYIYGDYVYYAVPSTEKNSKGEVKSSVLNFFRTKLDGTDTSAKITNEDYDSAVQFRFIESNGKVYLAIYNTALYVYDAEDRKLVYDSSDKNSDNILKTAIDELVFDEDNASNVIYFTTKPIDENLYDADSDDAQQVKYHEIHKYVVGEKTSQVALSLAGKYNGKNIGENGGAGLTGATADLIVHKGGQLYFSYTVLDSTVASTTYVAVKDSDVGNSEKTWEAVENEENILNYGDKNATAIFADSAYIVDKNCIIYVDSSYGLLKYDYTAHDEAGTDFGVTKLFYSENITSATLYGVVGDYLYYYDSSNYYYRVNFKAISEGREGEEIKLNKIAYSSGWYAPEVVKDGERTLLVGVYTGTVYGSYAYAIDVEAVENAYREAKASEDGADDFYTIDETYEFVKGVVTGTKLGVMNDTDKTAYEEYIGNLKHEPAEETAE